MACPYGSSPRPGAPNGFWLTLQGILSFLPSALNGWLAWSPDWLDGAYISTADLCVVPQPIVGAFPAADYLACQLSPLTQYGASCAVVRNWFNAYVRSLLWANQCQCDGDPAGCADQSPTLIIGATQVWQTWQANCFVPGCTLTITYNSTDHSGAHGFYNFLSDTPAYSGLATTSLPPNRIGQWHDFGNTFPHSVSVTIPSSWSQLWWYGARDQAGAVTLSLSLPNSVCGATPPTYLPAPATPAQPSDIVTIPPGSCATTADLCAELLRLEQYVSELTATANYLTRQLVPYSYVLGTPVSGLSGNGYVAVTECLGCIVTLTSVPATKGRSTGTPTRYFDVGRINWGDANGYHSHHPLHESPELILGIPDTATRIGYTLPPGVVATITPLRRTGA